MAQIKSDSVVIEISKLFKSGEAANHILSDEQLAVLAEVVEATVAEFVQDPSLVIEVSRLEQE